MLRIERLILGQLHSVAAKLFDMENVLKPILK